MQSWEFVFMCHWIHTEIRSSTTGATRGPVLGRQTLQTQPSFAVVPGSVTSQKLIQVVQRELLSVFKIW